MPLWSYLHSAKYWKGNLLSCSLIELVEKIYVLERGENVNILEIFICCAISFIKGKKVKLLFLLALSLYWEGKKVTNTRHHMFCICCEGLFFPWCAHVSSIHFSGSCDTQLGENRILWWNSFSKELLLTLTEDIYVDCKNVYCSTSIVHVSLTIY